MLFKVKKLLKNGYYGNGCLVLAWDIEVIFLCVPNF